MTRKNRHGAIRPTAVTYTNAITVCRKAKPPDLKTALQLLDDATRDGVKQNVFMYSAAIWTAERCGDYQTAVKLLKDMKKSRLSKPNIVSYDGGK